MPGLRHVEANGGFQHELKMHGPPGLDQWCCLVIKEGILVMFNLASSGLAP